MEKFLQTQLKIEAASQAVIPTGKQIEDLIGKAPVAVVPANLPMTKVVGPTGNVVELKEYVEKLKKEIDNRSTLKITTTFFGFSSAGMGCAALAMANSGAVTAPALTVIAIGFGIVVGILAISFGIASSVSSSRMLNSLKRLHPQQLAFVLEEIEKNPKMHEAKNLLAQNNSNLLAEGTEKKNNK